MKSKMIMCAASGALMAGVALSDRAMVGDFNKVDNGKHGLGGLGDAKVTSIDNGMAGDSGGGGFVSSILAAQPDAEILTRRQHRRLGRGLSVFSAMMSSPAALALGAG